MTSYPEIDSLALPEVWAALTLGYLNMDAITPQYKRELEARLACLLAVEQRLLAERAPLHAGGAA